MGCFLAKCKVHHSAVVQIPILFKIHLCAAIASTNSELHLVNIHTIAYLCLSITENTKMKPSPFLMYCSLIALNSS